MQSSFLARIALLVAFAALVLIALRFEHSFYGDRGRLTVSYEPDEIVFSWRGPIEMPMARQLAKAFDDHLDRKSQATLVLDSPGGSIREGEAVITLLKKIKQHHLVETRVEARRRCLSMCVPIYLQGDDRTAAPSSRWMFHEPRTFDAITGEEIDRPALERQYTNWRFFKRYFENSEMDPAWAARLAQDWRGKDIWRTGQQLYDERSNVILHLN